MRTPRPRGGSRPTPRKTAVGSLPPLHLHHSGGGRTDHDAAVLMRLSALGRRTSTPTKAATRIMICISANFTCSEYATSVLMRSPIHTYDQSPNAANALLTTFCPTV